jgi:hypothetical protein
MSARASNAIADLQTVTGRSLLYARQGLITPAQPDGSGVDAFVATLSAGPALRTAIIGLLADISDESARRLAKTSYTDRRRRASTCASLISGLMPCACARCDLIAGEQTAARRFRRCWSHRGFPVSSARKTACRARGNQKLTATSEASWESSLRAHQSNVRPSLETEDLGLAATWPTSSTSGGG